MITMYSRYVEEEFMQSTTTEKVVNALVTIFMRHGDPFPFKSDNGPQFQSEELLNTKTYTHRTRPPPQTNDEVGQSHRVTERQVILEGTENGSHQ